MKKRPA